MSDYNDYPGSADHMGSPRKGAFSRSNRKPEQRKAMRMNTASQYVYDDLPEGVEDKIEKFITKQSAVGV
jgi:hypothetical protein